MKAVTGKSGLIFPTLFSVDMLYIDAENTLPHIKKAEFSGQSLSGALYEEIGIRSVEVGTVMRGHRNQSTGKEVRYL
ncbi:MAG: hypothetical protein AAB268_02870 [Elusimicrobiota bacterium]